MEEFWKRFDEFTAASVKYAPDVYQRLLMFKYAESVAGLAMGGIYLAVTVVMTVFCLRSISRAELTRGEEGVARAVISGILAVGFGGATCGHLFNVWNWIGAWAPDARLLHDAFEAFTYRAAPR